MYSAICFDYAREYEHGNIPHPVVIVDVFAENLGYNDIVERLKALKEDRIKEVLGDEEN